MTDTDIRRPLAEGETIETVFEVRAQGDMPGALRAVLTSRFLHTVKEVAGMQCLVVGYQEVHGPKEVTDGQ